MEKSRFDIISDLFKLSNVISEPETCGIACRQIFRQWRNGL